MSPRAFDRLILAALVIVIIGLGVWGSGWRAEAHRLNAEIEAMEVAR